MSLRSPFVESFRRQAESLLAEGRRVDHAWTESGGGWVHLEVRADAPAGFAIHANVGPEYALVIASRTLSKEFPVAGPGAQAQAAARARAIVEFLAALLGPGMRVRERRAGRWTYHWVLERREGAGWQPVARWWSPLPWHYIGPRSEVISQNRWLPAVERDAPAG